MSSNKKSESDPLQMKPTDLIWIYTLARTTLSGWYRLIIRQLPAIKNNIVKLHPLLMLFIAVTFFQFIFGLAPWIKYQTSLSSSETVQIGARYKIVFIITFLPYLMTALIAFGKRLALFYLCWSIAAAVYIFGLFTPNPIHTLIIERDDYTFTFWLYLYGAAHLVVGALAPFALRNSLLSPAQIRSFFLDIPENRTVN